MRGIRYNNNLKHGAIKLVVEEGRSISEVSKKIGISRQTLRNWISAYEKKINTEKLKINELEYKLKEKQKRIDDLEEYIDILKKATIIFACI